MPRLQELGGQGQTMTLAVANGFPPVTYTPMLRPLFDHYRVMGLLPRALWGDQSPPDRLYTWKQQLAPDFIETIKQHDLRDIVGVGHSFGGVGTLLAANALPDRFKAVILLDPTIMPRFRLWGVWLNQKLGTDWGNLLSQRSRKRRYRFESQDEAYDYFNGKRLFRDWPDETVRLYAESMPPHPEGGVQLAWPREWETYYFRAIHTDPWPDLRQLHQTGLPLLTIRGGESDTLVPKVAEQMRRVLPDMAYHEIAGHGHLFPHTAPDQTSTFIREWLAGVG